MNHGGKRLGAGRLQTQLNLSRVLSRQSQGHSVAAIAADFGLTSGIIRYAITKHKQQTSKNLN